MPRVLLAFVWLVAAAISLPRTVLAHPGSAITVDRSGRIYFIDTTRDRLWRLDPDGRFTTVTDGAHSNLLAATPAGHLWMVYRYFPSEMRWILRGVSPEGEVRDYERVTPVPAYGDVMLALDTAANLYYLGMTELLRVAPDSSLSVWARPIVMTGARYGVLGPDSAIYVADSNRVLRVPPGGPAAVLAGGYDAGSADGEGAAARFDRPMGLAVDDSGNVYVADYGNRRVRRITPTREVTTVYRETWPWMPTGVAVLGPDVYVLERAGDYYGRTLPPLTLIPAVADFVGSPRVLRLGADGRAVTLVSVRRRAVVFTVSLALVAVAALGAWGLRLRTRGQHGVAHE